jgi:hypothetical protein
MAEDVFRIESCAAAVHFQQAAASFAARRQRCRRGFVDGQNPGNLREMASGFIVLYAHLQTDKGFRNN